MEMTTADLRIKLENLQRRQLEIQKDKKAAAKAYKDELDETQDEIVEVLQEIDDLGVSQ